MIRQDASDISLLSHYASRIAGAIIFVCIALLSKIRHIERATLARAGYLLLIVYCLLEMFQSVFSSVEIVAGLVGGTLTSVLMFLALLTITQRDRCTYEMFFSIAMLVSHGLFLIIDIGFNLSASWIKALLLAIATIGLSIFIRREENANNEITSACVDDLKKQVRFSCINSEHSPLALCLVVVPVSFAYGAVAQLGEVTGVEPGLFSVCSELMGMIVLAVFTLVSLVQAKQITDKYLSIMPIIASTLLLVPVSWPKYFFVPALIIKCEFLVFSVMMLSQICRLVHSTQDGCLFVPGVIMAVYHASLVLGRFAVAGFTTRTDPSMLTVMIVVLIALWTFFMMAFSLSAMFMTKRGDADSKDVGESPLDSYESAFVSFASDRSLTEREQRICWDYARGRTVEYIANSCGISKETVKTHLKRVYAKSSCHSRQELIDAIEGYS